MGNSKSVKKGVAVVTAVIVAVVMVCVSVVCNLFSTKTESSNQTYLDDARLSLQNTAITITTLNLSL